MQSQTAVSAQQAQQTNSGAMALITSLFFMWGFLTSLNDILVPHLKAIFDLNYAQVMLVQFAFFSAYFLFGVPAGRLIDALGYQRAMVAGLLTMAGGALIFPIAGSAVSYSLFLLALVVLAGGITILQVSANPYVAVIGPERTASSRLTLTQAFNSLGTTVAPWFGGMLILSTELKTPEQLRSLGPGALQAYRAEQASTVRFPYILIAAVLVIIAIVITRASLPRISDEHMDQGGKIDWAKHLNLILGAIGIFVYVGAEVAIGSFLVNYLSQRDIGGLTQKDAALHVSYYWGGAMVGRFLGAWILRQVRTGIVLGFCAAMTTLLVITSMLSSGPVAMWSILAVGLFNSIMFPSIFTLGIEGLGPLTGRGSGIMIAAIVGGAIIPVLQGVLADSIGIQHAFILPVICYCYIAYYGMRQARLVTAG